MSENKWIMEDFVVPIRTDSKWTPGPWEYQEKSDAYTHIVRAAGNRFICSMGQSMKPEYEANARLIAAAPEMAEALKALADECAEYVRINNLHSNDGSPATTHSMRRARAALAKARGES